MDMIKFMSHANIYKRHLLFMFLTIKSADTLGQACASFVPTHSVSGCLSVWPFCVYCWSLAIVVEIKVICKHANSVYNTCTT